MAISANVKIDLEKKFKKVLKTPAGFAFFVAIHDFVDHIEKNPSLSRTLSDNLKFNQELKIPSKYAYLKQIHQGMKDAGNESNEDLGHTRYMVLRELNLIRNNTFSETNSFWKKRELSRKLIKEIYERLNPASV